MGNFLTSPEMYINMKPKDIPKWDSNKFYWEQSKDAIQFFGEELRKFKEGINLNGYYMPGWMYFHLNFYMAPIFDLKTEKRVIKNPPFDDNIYFLFECYKDAVKAGEGLALWGTRGFAKSTFIGSHEHHTHICNGDGGSSMIVYKEGNDIASIRDMVTTSNGRIHPAFRLNLLRGKGEWKDGQDVVYGNVLSNNEEIINSQIRLINANNGTEKASEKGAGLTPIGYKMDEIGKYDPTGIFKSAKASFKIQGKALFTFLLSGCVCKGTKVWNNKGEVVNIEDLDPSGGILGFDGSSYSKEPIEWIKPPHEKPCYRIELTGGNYIECSNDHPFLTVNKSFAEATRAEDIKKGDYLYQLDKLDIFGSRHVKDAKIIGLMIGDGNYSKGYTPHLSCSDEDIFNFVNSKYNVRVGKTFNTKSGELYRNLHIKDFTRTLKDVGIHGQKKSSKRLPKDIHEWDKKSVIDLLTGYLEADGNIKIDKKGRLRVCLTSSVKDLLEQVKYQFYKLGIKTSIFKENRGENALSSKSRVYRLYISDITSCNLFKDMFTMISKKKNSVLDSYKKMPEVRRKVNTTYKVNSLKKGLKLDGVNVTNIVPIRVKSVTYIGVKPVYNLTAGNTNTYLANGFITFNTGGNSELSSGAKEMLLNPKDFDIHIVNWEHLNNMVPEEHITWKEDLGRKFSVFVPGQMSYRDNLPKIETTFGEFSKYKYDSQELNDLAINVTDWKGCKEAFEKKLSELSDDGARNSQRMYFPMTIDDSFLVSRANAFNKEKITRKLAEIKKNPKYNLVDIDVTPDGKITTTFSDKKLAEREYKGSPISAPFMIFDDFPTERPGLYKFVSGCDDYKADEATTSSLGSMYVIKRRELNEPLERIAASITERPEKHRNLYSNWEKLIRVTNAKCNIEAADTGFVTHLSEVLKQNPGDYLAPFLNPYKEANQKKAKSSDSQYRFGTYPHRWNKEMMITTVIHYTEQEFPLGYDDAGLPIIKCGIDLIEDPWLLQEMLDYTPDGNFDRVVSFGWALLYARHLDKYKIVPEDEHVKRFNQDFYGKKRVKSTGGYLHGVSKGLRNF